MGIEEVGGELPAQSLGVLAILNKRSSLAQREENIVLSDGLVISEVSISIRDGGLRQEAKLGFAHHRNPSKGLRLDRR